MTKTTRRWLREVATALVGGTALVAVLVVATDTQEPLHPIQPGPVAVQGDPDRPTPEVLAAVAQADRCGRQVPAPTSC